MQHHLSGIDGYIVYLFPFFKETKNSLKLNTHDINLKNHYYEMHYNKSMSGFESSEIYTSCQKHIYGFHKK